MDSSGLFGEAIQHPGLVLLMIVGGYFIAQELYNSMPAMQGLFSRGYSRDRLKERVTNSRLGNMLTRMDIDLQYYLFSQPQSVIEKHLRNCKRCENVSLCDCYLDSKTIDDNIDFPFCENNDSILKVKDQQDSLHARK